MIFNELIELQLEGRFALDIASVASGLRPRGLLHVPIEKKQAIENLLFQNGLVIEATRILVRQPDRFTREGVFKDYKPICDSEVDLWVEIWFRTPAVDQLSENQLYSNAGFWLSYPDCCVKFMEEQGSLANHYKNYLKYNGTPRFWEINRLASLFSKNLLMPEFFPCSLSCSHALNFVTPFLHLAKEVLPNDILQEGLIVAKMLYLKIEDSLIGFINWEVGDDKIIADLETARKVPLSKLGFSESEMSSVPSLLSFSHIINSLKRESDFIDISLQSKNLITTIHNCYWC